MAEGENDGGDQEHEGGKGQEQTRLLAACDDCGAVYAAIEVSDGTILPIGNREGCRCGGTEFSSLNESLESEDADPDPDTDPETGASGSVASDE